MLNDLEQQVITWARHKGIFDKATPTSQMEKTFEEVYELVIAVVTKDRHGIIDGIGDVTVTLIIQAHMQGLNLTDCLTAAYDEIKGRTGRMENGVFVKDE